MPSLSPTPSQGLGSSSQTNYPMANMDEFVEFVARGLVDDPESVSVTTVDRAGMSVIELRVAPADVGKVIGRRGTTIQAIRSLVQVGGAKAGRRCTVDLVED